MSHIMPEERMNMFSSSSSASSRLCTSSYQQLLLLVLSILMSGVHHSDGQITPPTNVNGRPVVANSRVYFLFHIPKQCHTPAPLITTFTGGGVIKSGNRALMKSGNPHLIYGNIEIAPGACLYIEPGCVLKFAPGMGMIVNGTLIARGSEEDGGRIVMTKMEGDDIGKPSGDWQEDARLSLGNTTRDGRLDLKYKGKWRAICTNYNNFTEIDANVTCRHLGFLKGNFTYHSYARNLTDYILWEKPNCQGTENNLFNCPGASSIQFGRHICDGQEVIGFECEGLRPGLALNHWRGIEFFNSTTIDRYQSESYNMVYMTESLSFLEYLDLSYTGLDIFHGQTREEGVYYPKAAISASPHVPMMNNVTISYGAYDALNLTEIIGPIHIANSSIANNRGYGMFIQSSIGRTLVNMTDVGNNWGDGIKFYITNLTINDFRLKFPMKTSMCQRGNSLQQTYPFYEHIDLVEVNGDERKLAATGGYCDRMFQTKQGMKIGVHFIIMERDPEASGLFEFRDGSNMFTIDIYNGSFPQSYTTKTNILRVKFKYTYPPNRICKSFPPCIRFLMQFTTATDVEEEFRLLMSSVHDNIGHGVNIQDMRSKVRISNNTVIANNHFGAGVRVYRGAGEIVINGTRIEGNQDAGVNITYSGGYQLFNGTTLHGNKGYGVITEYLKLNRTRIERENRIEMVRVKISWNELIGLRMGNYCRGGSFLVNESYFGYNMDEALEYLSCNVTTEMTTNLWIQFNRFDANFRHAIIMRPLLNTRGIITNNTFTNHVLGVMRVDNGYDLLISRWYQEFPVDFNAFENSFTNNTGRYVISMRLCQNSAVQKFNFKFNYFERNRITDSFPFLNPRSRANAVIVLSSSNVQFRRNHIENRDSAREVATHLVDPLVVIDATENYWGIEVRSVDDYGIIHAGIFDQDDRYNLASVEYFPALKTARFYEDDLASDVSKYFWNFMREGNILGGMMEERQVVIRRGQTYYVDRDIYIFKGNTLILEPGSSLKFAPSVGMVVHGILKADGERHTTPITFDLDDREEFVPMENRTSSVRLVDGFDSFEGRLEVEIDGVWGTVCNHGWILENSLLACQQLGLTFNREHPTARIQRMAPDSTPILMSWVSCEEMDIDLTKCRAINVDASACYHKEDVYIRCQPPTWAGITLAAALKRDQSSQSRSAIFETQIRHVQIKNGGLLDSDTSTLTPALRIDYNFYQISWLSVHNSISDGIHVSFNHPFSFNKMEYLTVVNNAGNGVVTKSPRLEVLHSVIDRNSKAGYLYDPFFTEYDALLIRNMIASDRRTNMLDPKFKNGQIYSIQMLHLDDHMFLVSPAGSSIEKRDYFIQVSASQSGYKLCVQVMDYLPLESVEKVTIYDTDYRNMLGPGVKVWEIEKDLVDFPILSGGDKLTIKLSVNGQLSGRLTLVVLSRSYNSPTPVLRTSVTNTTMKMNDQGVVTKHYNSPSNRRLELFHRHREEEIYFKDLKVWQSVRHAMHMPSVTKFHEDYIPTYEDMTTPERVAKIKYTIVRAEFKDNKFGVLAEHNHVDFANNVWRWNISDMTLERCKKGGLEIEVPRVNDETERETHAVYVEDSYFRDNTDFAFTIAGYYADVKINRNAFTNNVCLVGLISITGMEKKLSLSSNEITGNVGRFVMDMDILSHSEHTNVVMGRIDLNTIVNNRYEGPEPPGSDYSPKTYVVSVKGLQNIGGYRNLFNNKDLGYELVAGISTLSLGTHVNFTHNYWGYTDETTIRKRIFDFDDWNNYVIADYFPYLTRADIRSAAATGIPDELFLDPNQLGGRVDKSQTLISTGRPFIVQSDLTIMPGITLTIPPGAELQFRPDVGILVLGRLVANGFTYGRIKMRPLQPENNSIVGKRKRDTSETLRVKRATANVRLRGDGILFKDAGFLELYNASSKTWNIMCDSQFNEETAEVVCRELGKETFNVKVRFTHLFDHYIYGKPMYDRKEFWYNKYHCRGDENSLTQCITRYNYNLLSCVYAANYTFVTCGERNLEPNLQYWGNIRFATDSFLEQPLEADNGRDPSILSYVDIEGAGMLHGHKVGAIQTTYVTPEFRHINITQCADNGYDIVAPRRNLEMVYQNISGNLGFGVNILVLNGESSERKSSFLPSGPSTIPYNIYGLVDICSMEKTISLETRLILFYKYGPNMRDCVKVISSRKNVGLRFLQVNMFQEDFSRNVVEIFDGSSTPNAIKIGEITANSSNDDVQRIYRSNGPTLSVHIHASVAHRSYGFIAEVIKLPPSGQTYPNSNFMHTIEQAEIRKNEDGALQYKNVGETNPSLYIEHCWLADNGYPILNLTSPPSIDISLQSTINFRFSHNQVSHNKGGMYLFTHTSTSSSSLRGNLTNNIFAFGTHGEALNISGHYFQRLMLHQNYIYNYTSGDYRDIVHIKDVVVNLTHNYILRNLGHYILHTYDSDDINEPQLFVRNGIYDNNATALKESTIKIGSGYPNFTRNFLLNHLNDFEVESYPCSSNPNCVGGKKIQAETNWWGSERQAYVNGKTYDKSDEEDLVEVDFWPPILDNRSLVEGDCLPGWVLDRERCYRYMGGALPFKEAKEFCLSHGAFLAEARDREGFFNYLIRLMVAEQDWSQRVWVMSSVAARQCSAFEQNYIVAEADCGRRLYPFICETDPYLELPDEFAASIKAMIIGISVGVGGVIVLIIVIVTVLWCLKSKRREKERFERTASIRSSLNNLNKINSSLRGTKSTLTMLSEGHSRRRLNELDERSLDSSMAKNSQSSAVSAGMNGSIQSIHSDYEEESNTRVLAPRRDNTKPVHSLRPDRSGVRGRPLAQVEDERARDREEKQRERERRERDLRRKDEERKQQYRRQRADDEEERGKYEESSDDDSVKKDIDDDEYSDDSSFDDEDEEDRGVDQDEIDAQNIHYRINRAKEEGAPLGAVVAAAAASAKPPFVLPTRSRSRDDLYENQADDGSLQRNPVKSKSLSSFTQPELSIASPRNRGPLSPSRENLPTPPPDPMYMPSSTNQPKPAPRPKPLPPTRSGQGPLYSPAQSDKHPAPAPRQQSMGSRELLYNNQPGPQQPVYDDRSSDRSGPRGPLYNNMRTSEQGSRGHLYDPVYDGQASQASSRDLRYDPVYEGSSNHSRSTDKYEPVSFNPYGLDQTPDTDYMPRPTGNPAVGHSRERLGPPPPVPPFKPPGFRQLLESDIDSYDPSILSEVDDNYMPRKYAPSSVVDDDPLPPKLGANYPMDTRSHSSQPSHKGRRENQGSFPQPPPYTEEPSFSSSRSRSRDRLDQAGARPQVSSHRGSREHLEEEPPPYSPGEQLMPRRHGGRHDVLYLDGSGARPKTNQSIETDI